MCGVCVCLGGGGQHYSSGAAEPAAIEVTVLIIHTSLKH